jgi:fatty-acyl-CoA synthase
VQSRGPGNFGVGTWIERRARSAPHRPALITADGVQTYAALAKRIRRLAGAFQRMGVGHGDRIAWLGENHPAFVESFFAAGRIGAVLAPVNHYLPADERAVVVADADPLVVLEHTALPETAFEPSVLHRIAVGGSRAGALDYESLFAERGARDDAVAVDLDDLLFLPHTTGTTGRPKGVMLTHANVTWNVINFLTSAEFRNDDVTIAFAPFFRVGGTGVNVLPVLFMGGTVVVPEDVEPDRTLALIERHRVSVGFAGPGLLEGLATTDRWARADLSSLRFVLTGGAPVPDRIVRAYAERGVPLVQGYGLSEAGPLALLLDAASALKKIGSAGRPPAFVDVRIVDADGQDVPPRTTGELHVRGPNVMAGYWRRPDATREVLLDDGWLRTGDAVRMDDDGYIWIVDRFADRFETGGGIVFPGDIERVLLSNPAVMDAGVVGVPSPDGGWIGAGFVVLTPGASTTAEELIEGARRELPAHAVPATIRLVAELPRNSVGKLLRQELREI